MPKIWVFRSILFVVAAVSFVPFASFTQILLLEKALGLNAAEVGSFTASLVGILGKWTFFSGFIATLFFIPAAVLLAASVFCFDVLPENGELVIPRDSAYFRPMTILFDKDKFADSDGCGLFWRTFLFTTVGILLAFVFGLLLTMVVDFVLFFYANPWLVLKVLGIIIFAFGVICGLIFGGMQLFKKTFFGRVLKDGFFALKNGSCPRIRVG